MKENNLNSACEINSMKNSDFAPEMDAIATCDNQAEAAKNQAGSSGQLGTEFPTVDNETTRKLGHRPDTHK
ncbi:hypothetical protein [Peribacillus sp. SCS-155]|uniref:hypothetical protein n=1 Tax=Peribacillus sedimenti TaxID=3115297 RepID=UPI0039069658